MNRETLAKLHSLLRSKRGGLTSHYDFMLRFSRKQHGAAHSKVDVGHITLGTQNIKQFFDTSSSKPRKRYVCTLVSMCTFTSYTLQTLLSNFS